MNRLDSAQIYIFSWENDALPWKHFLLQIYKFPFPGQGEGGECILEPKKSPLADDM
jgi:hypothetical protein